MLDHVFLDAIAALRGAFERALLERQAFEEKFQTDLLLGDVTWETSYSLPGEGVPAGTRVDVTLNWPTWSQTAYRLWTLGETSTEESEIGIEVVARRQGLAGDPDLAAILAVLPEKSPPLGETSLHRAAPTVQRAYDRELRLRSVTVEVAYEGTYCVEGTALGNAAAIAAHFADVGAWVASTLVRLGDLELPTVPPDEAS